MTQETLTRLKLGSVIACTAMAWNAFAVDGKWNADASDNWGTASRWTNNQIADGVGATADISFNITAGRTLTLNGARTVGKIRFEDATTASHDWTFSASAANVLLTLEAASGSPIIEVANRQVNFNTVLAGYQGFTKLGAGTLALGQTANNFSGKVALNAGQTRFKATGTFGVDPGLYVADQITLNGGVLMNNDAPLVISPNLGITLGSVGGGLQAGWSKPITIDSPIVGAGALTNVSDATPAIITLNAVNSYTGPTIVSGWLQVNGSLDPASAVTVQSGGLLLGNGTVNGRLTVNANGNLGAGGLFAAGTLTVNNAANLTGCMLHMDLSDTPAGANDLLVVNGDLTLGGAVTVSVTPLAGTLQPGTYRLINYSGTLTGSAANLVAAPSRYAISFDTSTAGQVNMIVQGGAPANLVWKGTAGPNWDVTTTPNWLNGTTLDTFRNGDNVLLDDSGNNVLPVVVGGSTLVNTVVPGSVTVNANKDYTLSGGRLAGPMTLTKRGNGLLTLAAANAGLPYYFDGPIVVEGGRLRAAYGRALGSTNGSTLIRSGATFDVNGQDLGLEPIVVEGDGVGGTGALVNTGGAQNNALRLVTLTGNTTVGGTARFDIRNVEGIAFLNTDGHPYKLTKKGPNQFSLVGVVVDPALGDVDVQEGTFGFETTSTLGDPTRTLTMGFNTTLTFWNLSSGFYKPMVLGGGTAWNINNGSGSSTILGPVTLLAQSIWNVAGTSLQVSSDITGAGGLTKTGSSPLYLDGVNTYAGPTIISAGNVVLGMMASLSNSPAITLSSGTTLDVTGPAALSASGAFELNGAIGQTLSGSGTVTGNLAAGNGTVLIPGTSAGTLTCNGSLKLDNATAVFELGATTNTGINDLIAVSGDLTLSGTITLRISALAPLDTVNPYTIATYSGTGDFGSATFNILSDSRYTFTVDTTSAPGSIRVLASPVGSGAETLTWQGNVSGSETVWDLHTTANWANSLAQADTFYLGDQVRFDDTAANTTVSLTGTLTPATLTVSNATKNFAWSGSGKLSGTNAIVKDGAGKLTIANTGLNENTGMTIISAGTLEVGNGGTSGNLNSAAITNRGTLVFNRSDTITVANAIGGAGKVEKQGSGLMILSAAQPNLTGPVAVSAGTLRVGTATSLGTTAAGTTVADGATLDVNGLNLGTEQVTVSGTGVNSQGAIINTGGTQNNALHDVYLAGNTVFGGSGRWDIRINGGSKAILSTSSGAFNLTKVGANQISLVDVTVDTALADVDVQAGIFGYEATTTGLGDPNKTLTVRSNATFLFWGAATPLNKQVSLEGGSTINAGSGTANWVTGPVTLLDGMANLNSASGIIIYYQGPISGPGGIVKGDSGSVHLVGANTFTGNVVHNYGNLVLSNNLSLGTSKTLTVNYNTGASGGTGTRLYLRGGITTPADVTGIFNVTSLGGDYRCSLTSDVLTNTWAGPLVLQGSAIVGFYCDNATSFLNLSGPILGTNGFTGTAFFRGNRGIASLSGRISGKVQLPTGILSVTDNTAWEFNNPDNAWARTSIAYGKVVLGADNAACATAPLSLGQSGTSTGTLDLNGFNQTVPSITTVNGNNHWITNGSAAADSVFTYNGDTNVSTLDGRIVDGPRKLSLTVSSGALTLLGNNTYKGDTLLSGGTLALGAAGTLASTPLITLGMVATLDVSAKGTAGLSLTAGQTLVGAGTIKGSLTVSAGATLSAGAAISELAITDTLALAGTNVAQLNSSATPSSDLVKASAITYGGTLLVQNLGPALTPGSSFKLFSAGTYSGAFAGILPDKPGTGLAWDTSKLTVDGTLAVVQTIPATPTNITATVTANTLKLSWPAAYTGWRLEAQTNSLSTGLSSQWVEVPESTTTNEMFFPIDPSQPTVFFRLGYQVAP